MNKLSATYIDTRGTLCFDFFDYYEERSHGITFLITGVRDKSRLQWKMLQREVKGGFVSYSTIKR